MIRIIAVFSAIVAWTATAIAGTAFHDSIYGVATTSNITYGTGLVNNGAGTLDLKLDLYRPVNNGNGALPAISPGVVIIHGGSFVSGDKTDLAFISQVYASYGYTVASINYRMLGDVPPPTSGPAVFLVDPPPSFGTLPHPQGGYAINAAIQDATKAMGWMRDNAALYNVDANHIAIGGGSAGAITALLEAYNHPPAHAAPQAVLSFLGSMYGTDGTIQPGAPPAFVVHGDADTVVPFSGSQALVARLNALGIYNEFYVQAGLGHTVDFSLVFGGKTLLDHNMEFLAKFLVPEPSSSALAVVGFFSMIAWARRQKSRRR